MTKLRRFTLARATLYPVAPMRLPRGSAFLIVRRHLAVPQSRSRLQTQNHTSSYFLRKPAGKAARRAWDGEGGMMNRLIVMLLSPVRYIFLRIQTHQSDTMRTNSNSFDHKRSGTFVTGLVFASQVVASTGQTMTTDNIAAPCCVMGNGQLVAKRKIPAMWRVS